MNARSLFIAAVFGFFSAQGFANCLLAGEATGEQVMKMPSFATCSPDEIIFLDRTVDKWLMDLSRDFDLNSARKTIDYSLMKASSALIKVEHSKLKR